MNPAPPAVPVPGGPPALQVPIVPNALPPWPGPAAAAGAAVAQPVNAPVLPGQGGIGAGGGGGGIQAQPVEWKSMVDALQLQSWELAHNLAFLTAGVTLVEALEVSQSVLAHMGGQDEVALKERVKVAASYPGARHFLTVTNNVVDVISSLHVCPFVPYPTERMFGFRNDRVRMGQLVRELVMVKTAGNIAEQWTQFGFRTVAATAWADTVAWAATGQEIVAPVLGAVDPGEPIQRPRP
jgi:hypothetical protein